MAVFKFSLLRICSSVSGTSLRSSLAGMQLESSLLTSILAFAVDDVLGDSFEGRRNVLQENFLQVISLLCKILGFLHHLEMVFGLFMALNHCLDGAEILQLQNILFTLNKYSCAPPFWLLLTGWCI